MSKTTQKDKAPWYVRAFNADYLARYKHRSDELAQAELPFVLKALNLDDDATVLDLCCGAGRHSRALISAMPTRRVIGLDLSADLLRDAQAKNISATRNFFLRADMRRIPLATRSIDGVINLFTSFGYFKTDREHLNVLKEVARVLKPRGRFVIDFLNRERVLATLVKRSESEVNGCRVVETRGYDARSKRLNKTIRISDLAAQKSDAHEEILRESIRAYGCAELKDLLIQAGLKPIAHHGDLSGGAFDSESSPRCVWVCEYR